jgi:hypothetical protein
MRTSLTKKERLFRQVRGQEIDRVPTLGGWVAGIRNLSKIAGISPAEYFANPTLAVIKANLALGVDGMINPVVPKSLDEIRTGSVLDGDFTGVQPEALLERANSLPDNEKEVLVNFDYSAEEQHYREYFTTAYRDWEGIEPIPNFWEIGGHFPLYAEYGYSAFLMACALYPDAVGKIYWVKSLYSRERAKILVRLFKDFNLVPLMFCGEDLANNKGPMVSPVFLRKYYLPTVKMIIEPLVDAGVRFIHHCDGDIRSLIDDYLEIGFSGFQGFQYELGVDPYQIRKKRSRMGEELLFFTGLSVSRTLPFGSIQDIKDEVDYFLDFTDGGRGMFLFTSNVTGVEVPPENLQFAYRYIKEWDPNQPRTPHSPPFRGGSGGEWPWGIKHPDQ